MDTPSNEVFDFCKTLQAMDSTLPNRGQSGVYVIFNVATNRVYIGKSVNLRQRLQQHFSLLGYGLHKVPDMQKDWAQFGAESFAYAVYKIAPAHEIDEIERVLIALCNGTHCYNQPQGGAREGAGRKALDGAKPTTKYLIALTYEQREKIDANGGAPWVRGLIDDAEYSDKLCLEAA